MKKSHVLPIVLVCLLLIGLIVYHLPQRRQTAMPVCNAAGEVSFLEIDVSYYRRLFSTPWVEGTVTFDGVIYQDYYADLKAGNVEEHGNSSSYWGWDFCLSPFNDQLPSNMKFVKVIPSMDFEELFQNGFNQIVFFSGMDSNAFTFDKVALSYSDRSMMDAAGYIRGVNFYGPATTVEEARQVASEFGYNLN